MSDMPSPFFDEHEEPRRHVRALIVADLLVGSASQDDRHHDHLWGWCGEALARRDDFELTMVAIRDLHPDHSDAELRGWRRLASSRSSFYPYPIADRLMEFTLTKGGAVKGAVASSWAEDEFALLCRMLLDDPDGTSQLHRYCMLVRDGQYIRRFRVRLTEALQAVGDFPAATWEYVGLRLYGSHRAFLPNGHPPSGATRTPS